MQIRKRKYPSGGTAWQLDCGEVNGRRVQLSFATKQAAEAERAARARKLHTHGHAAFELSEEERIRFAAARDRLAKAGASIEQAVDHYLATKPTLRPTVTLKQLLVCCLAEKELLGLREHSLRQLKCSCGNFVSGREERDPSDITRDEVKGWVLGNGWAPKTQRGYLGDLRTLFSWAKEERYIAANPCCDGDEIRLAVQTQGDVEIFSAAQCEALLLTALAWRGRLWSKREQKWVEGYRFQPLLGYAALALFVGVRPAELSRCARADLDLDGAVFVVGGRQAKTRGRRPINLPAVASGWLRLWEDLCPGDWLIPPNFKRLWDDLRREAGLAVWPHDVLRHTAASMHLQFFEDEAATKQMLGHSQGEDTLFSSYRGVRLSNGRPLSRAEAERFYCCTPPGLYLPAKNRHAAP